MTKYLVEETTLTDIADAIREQTGDENPIMLSNFASQIANISGSTTVKKYTAELTSSQYGWFTFVDENGNVITKDSNKIPVLASTIDSVKYYIGSFVAYESQNRYLFKIYDVNNSEAHGYEGASKTLTFDLAYVESSSISGGGHSYSTDEHVIGTWIDGSTLYEKTFYSALPSSGGTQNVNIAHGISNLNIVVDRSISNFIRTGESVGTDDTSQYYTSIQSIDSTNITYKTTVDGAGRYVIITIRYTKTA